MDQARYWMWTDQRKVFARSSVESSYHDSWEEQAFAEDASGALGNCVWPPRSYSCSFCRREFRSAQALGGHMNVHRRDRARLKQSPNAHVEISHRHYHHQNPCTPLVVQNPSQFCTLSYHDYLDQKAISPLSVSLATSLPFSLNGHNLETKLKRDLLKTDLLLDPTKLARSRSPETDPDGCEDEVRTTKRRRRDSSSSPFSREFNSSAKRNRPSSTVDKRQLEVPNSTEELDLELRLGNKPKVK